MADIDKNFSGSIPALYDRYLVPMIFEPFARDLAQRIDGAKGRILELAAGTGAVTREIARSAPDDVEIVATDLNQPMLDRAAANANGRHIEWRQADACALPFGDGEFDVVVCQFGVMFFPDKTQAFRETRRALKPDGRFVFNVWDRLDANLITHAASEAVATVFPHDPPRFFERGPHGWHDVDLIRTLLGDAGFAHIRMDKLTLLSRAPSARDAAIGLCQGSPLRNEIEARDAGRLEEATEAATRELQRRFGVGPIEAEMRAIVVEAIR